MSPLIGAKDFLTVRAEITLIAIKDHITMEKF